MPGSIVPPCPIQKERKTFGCRWDRTSAFRVASHHFSHYTWRLGWSTCKPPTHVSAYNAEQEFNYASYAFHLLHSHRWHGWQGWIFPTFLLSLSQSNFIVSGSIDPTTLCPKEESHYESAFLVRNKHLIRYTMTSRARQSTWRPSAPVSFYSPKANGGGCVCVSHPAAPGLILGTSKSFGPRFIERHCLVSGQCQSNEPI